MFKLFGSMAALCLALLHPTSGRAQDYPSQDIRLVCGFVAGSGADVIHRYLARQFQALSGRSVIVENKPGASGNIAHTYAARAKPDGYSVYPVGATALAASIHLFKSPPVNPLNDFEVVGTLLKTSWYIVVDSRSSIKTLPELTAFLKQKRDKASYATATVSGTVFGELYKNLAELAAVQVNYKTIGDALNDLTSGAVDFAMADAAWTLANVRNGRVRALATSSADRSKLLADVPTMAEGGVEGINLVLWWALYVPKGTPQPAIDKLRGWLGQILQKDETEKFLNDLGTEIFVVSPEQAQKLLKKEMEDWGEYVRRAHIEPT